MNRIIITEMNDIRFLLIYENDILVECHPLIEKNGVNISDIYIGRVQKKLKNIDAAFISLDGDNIGYLPLDDKPAIVLNRKLPKGLSSIAENDLILVQVVQEPQKMKQARVTGNISVSGKYIVLDLNEGNIGVSKKITDKERILHLRELIDYSDCTQFVTEDILEDIQAYINSSAVDYESKWFRYGLVYRTAGEYADDGEILDEYDLLYAYISDLIFNASHERKTGLISAMKTDFISIIEDYGFDRINEIKTDITDVYDDIISYFHEWHIDYNIPQENVFVKNSTHEEISDSQGMINVSLYYDKNYPYYMLLNLESELVKLLNKKVWLKSGGFLIIEPTEAMVVIDVNTGKAINKKDRDKHVLKINLEAAKEIALQLRLRNLSGIIMVDFINMKSDKDKKQVISCLRSQFSKDKISTNFIDITGLDVYEITRKKQRRPLYEMLKYSNNKIVLREDIT